MTFIIFITLGSISKTTWAYLALQFLLPVYAWTLAKHPKLPR